jgi:hypothetical protein
MAEIHVDCRAIALALSISPARTCCGEKLMLLLSIEEEAYS